MYTYVSYQTIAKWQHAWIHKQDYHPRPYSSGSCWKMWNWHLLPRPGLERLRVRPRQRPRPRVFQRNQSLRRQTKAIRGQRQRLEKAEKRLRKVRLWPHRSLSPPLPKQLASANAVRDPSPRVPIVRSGVCSTLKKSTGTPTMWNQLLSIIF